MDLSDSGCDEDSVKKIGIDTILGFIGTLKCGEST